MSTSMRVFKPVAALTGILFATPGWAVEDVNCRQSLCHETLPYQPYRTVETGGIGLAEESMTTQAVGKGVISIKTTVLPDGFGRSTAFQLPVVDDRHDDFSMPNQAVRPRNQFVDFAASYVLPLDAHSSVSGTMGLPGAPALGPANSGMQRYFGFNDQYAPFMSNWLYSNNASAGVFTFGYTWRNFRFESSSFGSRDPDRMQDNPGILRMDSSSKRLSFRPAPDWMVQLSRGQLSNLDQLEPNRDIKRTTLSATYNRHLSEGDWQTIFAWGRNSSRYRESTTGYLIESNLRVATTHAFFGRLEQVGSDNLLRENESLQRQMFKMNKMTVGYAYDVPTTSELKFDVGGLVSKHYVPSAMNAAYGNDRVSYLMFVRFKLK